LQTLQQQFAAAKYARNNTLDHMSSSFVDTLSTETLIKLQKSAADVLTKMQSTDDQISEQALNTLWEHFASIIDALNALRAPESRFLTAATHAVLNRRAQTLGETLLKSSGI
jgi:hypothetical protein